MGERKEKAALNMAFSWTHPPPRVPKPTSPRSHPMQMVLHEPMRKDHTPRSRAVRLGEGAQCGLNKARNTKVEPSHLLLNGHPSYVFYCRARKDRRWKCNGQTEKSQTALDPELPHHTILQAPFISLPL